MRRSPLLGPLAAALFAASACAEAEFGAFRAAEEDGGAPADAATSDGPTVPDLNDGAATPADSGASEPSCSSYCDAIEDACRGDAREYLSKDECRAVCATLRPGVPGDRSNDTLACRAYVASGPAQQNSKACAAAGPWGGEVCGARCEAFCRVAGALCPAAFSSSVSCIKACATDPAFAWDATLPAAARPTTGASLNCRASWLLAAVLEPSACGNVAADSPACR